MLHYNSSARGQRIPPRVLASRVLGAAAVSADLPTFADIEAAAARIAGEAVRTPLLAAPALGARLGARVFVKPENLQRTGSFKFRGAFNRLSALPEKARAAGVVAFSSGNHAQGVAAAARILGMRAAIVMPSDAPAAKIEGTRAHGAEIVFCDRRKDDREAIARALAEERGAVLVPSFDDPLIVAGQGTIGREIAEDAAALGAAIDDVFVPCGGGGLVSGIALALSEMNPPARIFSVEPEDYDGMRRSLAAGARRAAPALRATLADALMSPQPGHIPFAVAQGRLAGGYAVSDAEISRAVACAFRDLKLVVEPGGAAALAALLAGRADVRGRTVVIVLSGGNADFAALAAAVAGT